MNLKNRSRKQHKYLNFLSRKFNLSYEDLLHKRPDLLSKNLVSELRLVIREEQQKQHEISLMNNTNSIQQNNRDKSMMQTGQE